MREREKDKNRIFDFRSGPTHRQTRRNNKTKNIISRTRVLTESFHFLKTQIPMAAATTIDPTTTAAVTRPPVPPPPSFLSGEFVGLVAELVPVAVRVFERGLDLVLTLDVGLGLSDEWVGGAIVGAVVGLFVVGGGDGGGTTAGVVVVLGGVGIAVVAGGVAPPVVAGGSASGMTGGTSIWALTVERRTSPRSSKEGRICIMLFVE